jgi:hypothetical protein
LIMIDIAPSELEGRGPNLIAGPIVNCRPVREGSQGAIVRQMKKSVSG